VAVEWSMLALVVHAVCRVVLRSHHLNHTSLTFGLQCDVQGSRCAVPEVGDAIGALCNNFGLVNCVERPIAATLGIHTLVCEGLAVHLAVLEALVVLGVHVVEAERLSRRSRRSTLP